MPLLLVHDILDICLYHRRTTLIVHVLNFVIGPYPILSVHSNTLRATIGGAIAHDTPLSDNDQCALLVLLGPGTGDRS